MSTPGLGSNAACAPCGGDVVLSTDPESGETVGKTVTATITGHGDKHLVAITVDIDDDRAQKAAIVATDGHPFWTPEHGRWTDAKDLRVGQRLQSTQITLRILAIRRWSQPQTVHNLTVADTHTYYVLAGQTPVLVHNCPDDIPTSRGSTGRTTPGGANEQRALDLIKENPQYGNRLPVTMRDSRWSADDGWVKMEQTVDGVEIHYVYNTRTGVADDFKFKDWSD